MKKSATAIVSGLIGAVAGTVGVGYLKQKQEEQKDKKIDKFKSYYNMLNQWLILKQEGKSLEQYFEKTKEYCLSEVFKFVDDND